jgi:hypothetical protein
MTVAVVAAAALALGGCGSSPSSQVRDKVAQLAQAVGARDYTTICAQILAPSLVAHLSRNGIPCPGAMHLALGDLHSPVVSVGRVVVRGSRAYAITLTSARGQRATLTAIALRRTPEGWRITSLDSPLSAVRGR